MRRIYDFFRLWIIWKDAKEAWQDSKTINDKEFRSEIRNLDIRLEEFLDSILEEIGFENSFDSLFFKNVEVNSF